MNARAPQVILLDWDGTLADVVPISAAAVNATRLHRGEPALSEDEARSESAKALPILFPDPNDRNYFIATHVKLSHENPPPPLEGADALVRYLNGLRAKDVYVGIISNKPRANIEREMKQYGWDGMFDTIVGSDDVTKGKPEPEPLAKALEAYAKKETLRPQQILYIGDSPTDAAFAKNCGIKFIGVDEKKFDTLKPEERCNNLHELLGRMKLLMRNRDGGLPDF